MAVALDELHDQRSDGGHRSSLEESYGNVSGKKIARVFRHKFPVNYRSSLKNHFKIPGIFKTILGNESAVSLWRKRHFFFKTLKTLARFSPRRVVCVFVRKHFCRKTFLSETLVHEHVASCFIIVIIINITCSISIPTFF